MKHWLAPVAVVLGCVALVFTAQQAKDWAGVDVSIGSLDQLREFVISLGIWGPLIFLVVATFRVFFLVPSWVLLTVGGLAFGAQLGALLGAVGITLSALLGFAVTRFAGGTWIRRWVSERYVGLEARLERAGLMVIGLTTAHPAIPMSGFHWAAGLTALPFWGFLMAVLLGASLRSLVLAFLGASVVDLGILASAGIGLFFAVFFALPLAHRGLRERLLGHSELQS